MRLSEVMTREVVTVHPSEPVTEARERMRRGQFRHLVVREGQRLLGVVSDRDLRDAPRRDAQVGDVMTLGAVTVGPETRLAEAAELMRRRGLGCLPVVEGGALLGIVTTSDLLGALERLDR